MPLFAPDGVIYPFPEWVEHSVYRGRDGLRAIFAVWTANFDDFELEIPTSARGRQGLRRTRSIGRGEGNGRGRSTADWERVHGVQGKVDGATSSLGDEALKAVGLSE